MIYIYIVLIASTAFPQWCFSFFFFFFFFQPVLCRHGLCTCKRLVIFALSHGENTMAGERTMPMKWYSHWGLSNHTSLIFRDWIHLVDVSSLLTMKIDCITKTYLYSFDPIKPHFYIVKRGLQGYTLIFLYLLKNIDCGDSLEPPRRGGSNEYPQIMFWAENFFIWKVSFFGARISIYLNMRIFIMVWLSVCIAAYLSPSEKGG